MLEDSMLMLRELVDTLRADGIDAKAYQIHHAISVGHLPRPPLVSGRFVFDKRLVAACRQYLSAPPRPGRRAATKEKAS
jgi:Flp pilus assembly protein CpaB